MDLDDGWLALYISIVCNVIPEQAFRQVEGKNTRYMFTEDDIKDMILMREEGIIYREIGEMYCTTRDGVYANIKRYKNKCAK